MSKKQPQEITGNIRMNPGGFAFVMRDDGEDDVFIGNKHRGLALDGDEVAISTWVGDKGTEGRVDRVISHKRKQLVGTVAKQGRSLCLQADDPRITASVDFIRLSGEAPLGQVVVAEITKFPFATGGTTVIEANVTRVLGEPEDILVEIEKSIVMAEIPDEFPSDVAAAGDKAPTSVRPQDLAGREDLRGIDFLTIDPETARDFDDACAIGESPRGEGWDRVWVAVADVSHYVRPGTALDREARARGCSVYLPNRAIPMLPEPLSSGICSLNPEVDRLAMVARVDVGPDGRTADHHFSAAVIRSRARFDYPGVAAAWGGDTRGSRAKYEPWLPTLHRMRDIAKRMRALRTQRGALDFDLPEAKVILDKDDPKLVRDVVRARGDEAVKGAYQMIEDFMLAANEAVALRFTTREEDAVWRIHDIPSAERLEMFASIVESYGMRFDAEHGKDPRKLRDFIETLHGKPAEPMLQMMLLRALKQAQYDVHNVGHFGLAARDYVHFTSPIRRYPDLLIHRLLKRSIAEDGGDYGDHVPPENSREELAEMAAESSAHERRAMDCERDVVDLYRAALMRDRVGEEFDAKVVSVASFGLFAAIDHPYVEGLIKIQQLPGDFYEFDNGKMQLVGRSTGKRYTLGQPIRIKIDNVSITRRQIDFSPAIARTAASFDDHSYSPDDYPKVPAEPRKLQRRKRAPGGGPSERKSSSDRDRPSGKLGVSGAGKGKLRLKVSGHASKRTPDWVTEKRAGGKKKPKR